jgi:hypothetical protein
MEKKLNRKKADWEKLKTSPGKNVKHKKHQQEHKGYKRKTIDILFFNTKK